MKYLLLAASLISLSAMAAQAPLPLASDGRIEVVPFEMNNVVPVYGTPFTTTQIIFAKNQYIVDVQGGDGGGWTPYWDKYLPNILNLKLAAKKSNTNMTVVTDSKLTHKTYFYYFHLVSSDNPKHITYAIRFLYPALRAQRLAAEMALKADQHFSMAAPAVTPGHLNWDYSFNGDKAIMPLHVYDNGQFTYLQFLPNQAIPAVFVVTGRSGKEALVNFRRHGNTLIIERTAPQFTLREGASAVASVFNNRAIQRIRHSATVGA